jgi:hypothetical protein
MATTSKNARRTLTKISTRAVPQIATKAAARAPAKDSAPTEEVLKAPPAESQSHGHDVELEDEDLVTVLIPRAYNFTQEDHKVVHYKSGIEEMPRSHAEHWFSKGMGVEIVTKGSNPLG